MQLLLQIKLNFNCLNNTNSPLICSLRNITRCRCNSSHQTRACYNLRLSSKLIRIQMTLIYMLPRLFIKELNLVVTANNLAQLINK